MGEMADYYAEMASTIPDWMLEGDDSYNQKNRFDEFRNDVWQTKDGTVTAIKDMTSKHLLAAYKVFGDKRFRDELFIRLVEAQLQNEKPKTSLGHLL